MEEGIGGCALRFWNWGQKSSVAEFVCHDTRVTEVFSGISHYLFECVRDSVFRT